MVHRFQLSHSGSPSVGTFCAILTLVRLVVLRNTRYKQETQHSYLLDADKSCTYCNAQRIELMPLQKEVSTMSLLLLVGIQRP